MAPTPGPAVALRETREEDLPLLFAHQLDPEASRMAAFPPRDRAAFFAHWRGILADDRLLARTITADGQVAGHIGAFDMDGERHVGYWIARERWGQGIATQALALLLREEPRRPLHACVAKNNAGSIRVLEKCGFRLARERRGAVRGEEVDERVYVLSAEP